MNRLKVRVIGFWVLVAVVAVGWVCYLPFSLSAKASAQAGLGDWFGAGALLLAVLGTSVAWWAYLEARKRPRLKASLARPLTPKWGEIHGEASSPEFEINIQVRNEGNVAARYVALRVSLPGANLNRSGYVSEESCKASGWHPDPRGDLDPKRQGWSIFEWEGGDRMVHPEWDLLVPSLCVKFDGLLAAAWLDSRRFKEWFVTVDIVCDGMKKTDWIRLPDPKPQAETASANKEAVS